MPSTFSPSDEEDVALGEDIAAIAATIDAATHTLLTRIRAFDERQAWHRQGAISCAHWLSWRIGLDLHTARERVRVARALGSLACIDEAFRKGALSYAKVRALTRIARPETDQQLAEIGLHSTGAQLEIICRRTRSVETALALEEGRPVPERSIRQRLLDNGLVRIEATLHPDEAALVWKALQEGRERLRDDARAQSAGDHARRLTDATVHEDGAPHDDVPAGPSAHAGADQAGAAAGDAGPPGPSLADALVLTAESFLAAAAMARPAPERHHILIHLEQHALGPDGTLAASLDDGTPVPAETLRRLACDGSLSVVTHDESGQPVHVSQRSRTVSGRLRTALWARDRGCRFPGCTHRLYVDAHHIQHWAHGGETSLGNTVLLCARHHVLLHEGGFRLDRAADGALVFQDANGGALPAVPVPAEPPDDAVASLGAEQRAHGVVIDALTNLPLWDGFPPDYERIVEVAGGWG